jgi:hypothetical protein
LRASDRDRDVVLAVLADGYADGRLTKEEYDERAASTASAKTLGELPGLVLDLVPDTPARPRSDLALATPEDLHNRAVQAWEAQRRRALTSALVPTLICWFVWIVVAWDGDGEVTGFDPGFPWPLFVMFGTGMNALRVLLHRQDLVAEEERRLEKRQRKALETPKTDGSTDR